VSNPKVIILVLVLVIGLFVALVVVGVGQDDGTNKDGTLEKPDWTAWLEKVTPAEPPVSPADLHEGSPTGPSPAGAGIDLVPGQTTAFHIAPSKTRVRTLRLALSPGPGKGKLTWRSAPDPGTGIELRPLSLPLYPDKAVTLKVLRGGGTLELSAERAPVGMTRRRIQLLPPE
jgi:hypothetical protein